MIQLTKDLLITEFNKITLVKTQKTILKKCINNFNDTDLIVDNSTTDLHVLMGHISSEIKINLSDAKLVFNNVLTFINNYKI